MTDVTCVSVAAAQLRALSIWMRAERGGSLEYLLALQHDGTPTRCTASLPPSLRLQLGDSCWSRVVVHNQVTGITAIGSDASLLLHAATWSHVYMEAPRTMSALAACTRAIAGGATHNATLVSATLWSQPLTDSYLQRQAAGETGLSDGADGVLRSTLP